MIKSIEEKMLLNVNVHSMIKENIHTEKKSSCFDTGEDVGNTKCQIIFFSNIYVCIFSETLNDLTKKDEV